MPKTYYDSELTGAQIEDALEAIHGVVTPSNNGKVLCIVNGAISAKSASEWGHGAVLEPLSVTANGDYYPPSGTDGFSEAHVAVSSYPEPTGTINISANGLVNVKDYAEANVQVPGGSEIEVIPLSVTANGTYTAPAGKAYSPVTVNVSGSGPQFVVDMYSPLLSSIFDTEAPINSGNTIEVAFYAESYVNDGHIVGQSYSSAGTAFHLTTFSSRWYYGGTSEGNFPADSNCPLYGTDIVYKAKTGEVSMNGVVKATNFTMPNQSTYTYKLNTRGGSVSTRGVYKYKYVRVYDSNNELVCDWEFGHMQMSSYTLYLAHEKVHDRYKLLD